MLLTSLLKSLQCCCKFDNHSSICGIDHPDGPVNINISASVSSYGNYGGLRVTDPNCQDLYESNTSQHSGGSGTLTDVFYLGAPYPAFTSLSGLSTQIQVLSTDPFECFRSFSPSSGFATMSIGCSIASPSGSIGSGTSGLIPGKAYWRISTPLLEYDDLAVPKLIGDRAIPPGTYSLPVNFFAIETFKNSEVTFGGGQNLSIGGVQAGETNADCDFVNACGTNNDSASGTPTFIITITHV